MKKLLLLAALAALTVSCTKDKKILILYYSQTSNTKAVAEALQSRLGADIEEIIPVVPYDGDFGATIERGRKELEMGFLPDLQPLKSDLKAYDIIFLGYPVWFGTYANPIATVLDMPGMHGKTIVPFCTFGSGGLDSSSKAIAEKLPENPVMPGYGIRAARLSSVGPELDRFLVEYGYIKGSFEKLPDFSEFRPVTEEEAAIFDAAVGSYPMIHAKAAEVASRDIEDGVEYKFIARDLPRENGGPAPGHDIQVNVLAKEGCAPEFTQVIR